MRSAYIVHGRDENVYYLDYFAVVRRAVFNSVSCIEEDT